MVRFMFFKPSRFSATLGPMRRRPIAGADTVAAFHSLAGMGVLSGRVGGSLLSMQRAPFALIKVRASSSSTSHPGSAGSVKSHSQGAKAFSTAMQMAEEAQQTQRVVPVHPVYAATTATTPAPDSAPFPGPSLHGPRGQDWWTGLQPLPGVCPGVAADGTLHSLPQLRLPSGPLPVGTSAAQRASAVRMQLQQYFDNTWTMTEVLLSSLQGEESFTRPPYHDLRHPMIFYYGHPAAFYTNKLRVAGLVGAINPYFEVVFETGVDEMSWDDLSKNHMAWPTVAEVHEYRKQVYNTVCNVIATTPDAHLLQIDQQSPLWSLVMCFEHERIHFETSSFLLTEMPKSHLSFPKGFPAYHSTAGDNTLDSLTMPVEGVSYPPNPMVLVPASTVTLGKPLDYPSFGWDNEYGQRTYSVPAFRASTATVCNGEFLQFVRAGGYADRELWSAVGWEWRAFRNAKWPSLWERTGPQGLHEYTLQLVFDQIPLQRAWDWPAVVNLHEAKAFAAWKTRQAEVSSSASDSVSGSASGSRYRVLTELEHRAIRGSSNQGVSGSEDAVMLLGGGQMMDGGAEGAVEGMLVGAYNTNLACGSMSPVNALPLNSKGFRDVFGNAWEWCEDYFAPLVGFQVHPLYEDFSTPCFDGLHHVIQGGSFVSTGNEASHHARFHFRPHFFQHAGFRLAQSEVETVAGAGVVLTSDTDAPGPYVGSYPFRRSAQAEREGAVQSSRAVAEAVRTQLLLRHYRSSAQSSLATCADAVADKGAVAPTPTAMISLARRVEQRAISAGVDLQQARLLDVGCGPGGLTFALASLFPKSKVLGFDHSLDAVQTARALASGEGVEVRLRGEGTISRTERLSLAPSTFTTPSVTHDLQSRVSFRQADPMCLPAELQALDCVVLHDVLDAVASPNAVLGRLGGVRGLVRQGGLLAVLSAYQWRENTTPVGLWLGGYLDQGVEVDSELVLRSRLDSDFLHLGSETLPVFWKEGLRDERGLCYSLSFFQRR